MANGTTPSVPGAGGGRAGRALGPAALALLTAFAACSPVATWRDLTGVSKNDPNPATTPNAKNLAAGEASPYPNLATVPPPPTRELTEAELRQLTQSLVADRTNAKYTDQQLRAASSATEPPASPAPAAGAAATAVALGAAPSVQAAPMPAPKKLAPIVRPAATGADAAAAVPQVSGNATEPAAPQDQSGPDATDLNGMASGLRQPGQRGRPRQPGPMESSLVAPQIRETPQPEPPVPAPPPPRLAALPAGRAPAPPPPPAGAAAFQPPPPPVLASPPPPPVPAPPPTQTAIASPAGAAPVPLPAPPAPVAKITFAAGSKSLSDGDLTALKKVAALYREHPGKLRVVGYVWAVGAADPLTTFSTALDQAQAVAAALAKTGIPAARIAVEAAPAKAAAGGDHAEVLLEH